MRREWTKAVLADPTQAVEFFKKMDERNPEIGAVDTETNGLHIIDSKPFFVQFGYLDPKEPKGYVGAVDLEADHDFALKVVRSFLKRAKSFKYLLGHNLKFDLHMLCNIGLEYVEENCLDTMFLIRYGHDNLKEDKGGPPLGLKKYCTQYIDAGAKALDSALQVERSGLAKDYNMKLREMLRKCPNPPEGYKSWTVGALDAFFGDKITDYSDLPPEAAIAYVDWLYELPPYLRQQTVGLVDPDTIRYNDLNRKRLAEYALQDIVLTCEVYESLIPIVTVRDNWLGVEFERSALIPLFDMERVGFKVDKEYLEDSRIRMKTYIRKRRKDLEDMLGEKLKVGQHAVIGKTLQDKFGCDVKTTKEEELARISANLKQADPGNPTIEFIDTILELRTLEKWYSAYIMRFQRNLVTNDRLYTTINQVGAVTGRVTSDFQQFPKEGILTKTGEELFSPRRMVISSGPPWKGMIYLDYSQVELRLQAMYTILVGNPEPNLCGAYMPYGCVSEKFGTFDCNNLLHLQQYKTVPWYHPGDDGKRWSPVDVHAETTKHAFGVTEDHPDFKKLRAIGKTINFAKNYGAGLGRMREMFPDKSPEEIQTINDAYYKAFPGVKSYHDYCYRIAMTEAGVPNLFGVKYYNMQGHNLINALIQGSSAYLLKWKIRQVWEFLQKRNAKSRFQMNIHDELSFEWHRDDPPSLFFEIKELLENWPDTLVPLVSDMSYAKETWGKKTDIHGKEDLVG